MTTTTIENNEVVINLTKSDIVEALDFTETLQLLQGDKYAQLSIIEAEQIIKDGAYINFSN